MLVIKSGMLTLVNLVQLTNAKVPMLVRLLGRVMLVKLVQL